jgi:chromosome segregation ATPase
MSASFSPNFKTSAFTPLATAFPHATPPQSDSPPFTPLPQSTSQSVFTPKQTSNGYTSYALSQFATQANQPVQSGNQASEQQYKALEGLVARMDKQFDQSETARKEHLKARLQAEQELAQYKEKYALLETEAAHNKIMLDLNVQEFVEYREKHEQLEKDATQTKDALVLATQKIAKYKQRCEQLQTTSTHVTIAKSMLHEAMHKGAEAAAIPLTKTIELQKKEIAELKAAIDLQKKQTTELQQQVDYCLKLLEAAKAPLAETIELQKKKITELEATIARQKEQIAALRRRPVVDYTL